MQSHSTESTGGTKSHTKDPPMQARNSGAFQLYVHSICVKGTGACLIQ